MIHFYIILSVLIVSLVSVIGVATLALNRKFLSKILLILVSLSAGTLFGDAFLHLLPEAVEDSGFTLIVSLNLLAGVIVFFLVEKVIHWGHCHTKEDGHRHLNVKKSKNPSFFSNHIAIMNLMGDAAHNFMDGLIIAASYMINIPAGIATTLAVVLHEIPQEIADFGVLIYSGLSKFKAIMLNILSALTAVLGAIIGIILQSNSEQFLHFILPFTAGGFVYIAGSNLLPELHKECGMKQSIWHFFALLVGIGLMVALKFLE